MFHTIIETNIQKKVALVTKENGTWSNSVELTHSQLMSPVFLHINSYEKWLFLQPRRAAFGPLVPSAAPVPGLPMWCQAGGRAGQAQWLPINPQTVLENRTIQRDLGSRIPLQRELSYPHSQAGLTESSCCPDKLPPCPSWESPLHFSFS